MTCITIEGCRLHTWSRTLWLYFLLLRICGLLFCQKRNLSEQRPTQIQGYQIKSRGVRGLYVAGRGRARFFSTMRFLSSSWHKRRLCDLISFSLSYYHILQPWKWGLDDCWVGVKPFDQSGHEGGEEEEDLVAELDSHIWWPEWTYNQQNIILNKKINIFCIK